MVTGIIQCDVLVTRVFLTFHPLPSLRQDRKSTRLNSSHSQISYAVFCLKKKKRVSCNRSCLLPLPPHTRNTPTTSAHPKAPITPAPRTPYPSVCTPPLSP